MSIWADIHKRSNGVSEKKEDIVVREEEVKKEFERVLKEIFERWKRGK